MTFETDLLFQCARFQLSFNLKTVQRRDANGTGNLNDVMSQSEETSWLQVFVLVRLLRIVIIQGGDVTPTLYKRLAGTRVFYLVGIRRICHAIHFKTTYLGQRLFLVNRYLILLLLLPFILGPLVCSLSELIWNYGSYRQFVGPLGRVISPVARPLLTQEYTQKTRGQTSIPRVGFQPTIPVLQQAKSFHAFGCVATVIDI
jgi:hypothetical protein